jgi:membrane protease YdiL (CAAX protease family)
MLHNLIVKNPVASYFLLAMALGAGTIVLVAEGLMASGLVLVSVLSASVAGVVMTAAGVGRAGLDRLFARLLIWRVHVGYWLFSFFFIVPVFLIGSVLNPLFGGDPIVYGGNAPVLVILPMFIGFFIVAGLGQELGWTGFLVAKLQSRRSALESSAIRGVLVGAWHLPLLMYSSLQNPMFGGFPYQGWVAQKGLLIAIAVLVILFAIPWSIFFTWIYNNTGGSLLLVAVLHGSEIWVAYLMMVFGINPDNINNYWGYGAVLASAALIFAVVNGGQDLSRKRTRIRDAA